MILVLIESEREKNDREEKQIQTNCQPKQNRNRFACVTALGINRNIWSIVSTCKLETWNKTPLFERPFNSTDLLFT